jgi:hypothetical protein
MGRVVVKHTVSPPKKNRRTKSAASTATKSVAGISPKQAAFIRKHWPAKGRAERIARAEQAWKEIQEIASTFKKLDPETLRWIAEDPDLEYM